MRPLFPFTYLLLCALPGHAGTVVVSKPVTQVDVVWSADFHFDMPLTNNDSDPLAGGTPFQVGFFQGIASTADPTTFGPDEWRTFLPLAGEGSRNPSLDPRTDTTFIGYISTSVIFMPSIHVDIPTPPDPSVLVGIRFFDQSTVAGSNFYNTVSSVGWIMEPAEGGIDTPFPTFARLDIVLLGGTLAWESNDAGFSTTIPLPEPSSLILALFGAGLFLRRRR